MSIISINFAEKIARLNDIWQPRVIAELNNYQFKVVRLKGDFVWHDHPDTDEAFIILSGCLRIDIPDGSVMVKAGEMVVIPKGIKHKPFAEYETHVLLLEPRGTLNTGSVGGERTVENDLWV